MSEREEIEATANGGIAERVCELTDFLLDTAPGERLTRLERLRTYGDGKLFGKLCGLVACESVKRDELEEWDAENNAPSADDFDETRADDIRHARQEELLEAGTY